MKKQCKMTGNRNIIAIKTCEVIYYSVSIHSCLYFISSPSSHGGSQYQDILLSCHTIFPRSERLCDKTSHTMSVGTSQGLCDCVTSLKGAVKESSAES